MLAALLLSGVSLAALSPSALAQGTPPAPAPEAAPSGPGLMIGDIKLSGQINAGFMLNPGNPSTGLNFGHLFTDRSNAAQINQILLTAEKAIDKTSTAFQWGFKLQGMYGSDARFTQYLGVFNNALPYDRYQFDIVEANLQLRLPVFAGGMDIKAGMYATPVGYETIDPSTNPFYSHSYMFQFGLPFKHTGLLTVSHVSDMLDIYAGIDTGSNTTFGSMGDNNGAVAGIAGIGLNLMDGKLTVVALSHFGPEQATRFLGSLSPSVNANGTLRSFNDIVITYKATEALTLVTDLNWVRDSYGLSGKPVNGFGVAQYVSYALTDTLTLNARGEVWRDDNNYFVASFSGNSDPVRFQQALPTRPVYAAPGTNTTYGSLTLGVTWKPELPTTAVALAVRPEIRWDHAFTNNRPFGANPLVGKRGSSDSFTFGADLVLSF